MSTQDPQGKRPEVNETPATGDEDQSEALKHAILKLKNAGMLTHVPEDLQALAGEPHESVPESTVSDEQTPPATTPQPDDVTLASRPDSESPTATTTDDAANDADERARWAAVMTGWDVESDSQNLPEDETPEPAADDWALPTAPDVEESESSETEAVESDQPSPSEITLRRTEIKPQPDETVLTASRDQTPWTLQQFFDGEIDLEQELLKRLPAVPTMTTIKFRTLGVNSGRKVATLSTQDGNASLIFDADVTSKVVQLSFTYGSMITLRFILRDLPVTNRDRWLELMRREKGGLAFLWNEDRWREDYLICVSREYTTNVFAFSPRNFESAVRLTKSVTAELLNWLETVWNTEPESQDDDEPPLLTW